MTSITDHFRDQFHALLLAEAGTPTCPEPVITLPVKPVGAQERSLACSMQQMQSSLAEVSRLLAGRPDLAPEWRAELLECGRSVNFAIQLATSRMRTLGMEEQFGRAP